VITGSVLQLKEDLVHKPIVTSTAAPVASAPALVGTDHSNAGSGAAVARGRLDDACDHFAPSTPQRLDLSDLYVDALNRVWAGTDEAGEPRLLLEAHSFTLDELLAKRRDVGALIVRLGNDQVGDQP
jgi:hypothetical protein